MPEVNPTTLEPAITSILTATYGEEVREAIHDCLVAVNNNVLLAYNRYADIKNNADHVPDILNDLDDISEQLAIVDEHIQFLVHGLCSSFGIDVKRSYYISDANMAKACMYNNFDIGITDWKDQIQKWYILELWTLLDVWAAVGLGLITKAEYEAITDLDNDLIRYYYLLNLDEKVDNGWTSTYIHKGVELGALSASDYSYITAAQS